MITMRRSLAMMATILLGLVMGPACLGSAHAAEVLVAAVLPASRAVAVNATATAFATIINTASTTAQNCSIALPPGFTQATFSYQTTNPTTNQVTGSPNTPVSIAAGGSQTFVFSVKPTAAFTQADIPLRFSCASGETAAVISGVNTFLLTASNQATPDVVALAATVSNDGIVRTPGTAATGAFAVATVNVGTAGPVVASVDTGNATVNAGFTICQTDAQAACLQPPSSSVTTSFNQNQTGTFSVFVTSYGTVIPLDPANVRVFVRFRIASGSVGATSVAVQTQITLGGGGGSLQLGAVNVNAPPGSVVSPTEFAASTTSLPASLPAGIASLNSAYAITLTNPLGAPDNGLNAPVNIRVPYGGLGVTDPSRLAVLHYDSATGAYEPTTIHDIDTTNQTITFDSRAFSSFVLVLLNAGLPPSAFASNFVPVSNGFAIVNNGNQYLSPGGNCVGMSSFTLWYYQNRGAGLYSHYSTDNQPASIQDLVATRAHVQQSAFWGNLINHVNDVSGQRAHPDWTVYWLRNYLTSFQTPFVVVAGYAAFANAHAILVYGYDANFFYLYDPNHPGIIGKLPYTLDGFGTYDVFDRFAFIGRASFGSTGNYAQLATEADGGFLASTDLHLASPQQGATLNQRQIQLAGYLDGHLNQQSQVYYWQNGLAAFNSADVSEGAFNKTIDVASGKNTVVVLAGVRAYSGQVSTSLANAAARIVTFTGPPAAKFRSTLNWNEDDTDVDQYVTEPTGDTSWYSDHTTAAGLTLDFDNTGGYGPENTTIEAASTPIPGVYTVRLHYYSDHGTGQAVDGTVTITVNERSVDPSKPQVGPVIKRWTIGVSNPSNHEPGDTGPDWVDIADVDVVNGSITLR
jgi:uncharacterized protein YfaP (DUF2135 family)